MGPGIRIIKFQASQFKTKRIQYEVVVMTSMPLKKSEMAIEIKMFKQRDKMVMLHASRKISQFTV